MTYFFNKKKKNIFNKLRNQFTLQGIPYSVESLKFLTESLCNKASDAPSIIIVWDYHALGMRIREISPDLVSTNKMIHEVVMRFGMGHGTVHDNTIFSFPSHKDLMHRCKNLSQTLPWCLSYSNVPRIATVYWVSKMDSKLPKMYEYFQHPFYLPSHLEPYNPA
ncbi:hypothetical protein DFA_05084 [Cavenderia fasciculata]|uniref:Uncharacterized protein n=1 Tax=Cavenderia fasciculata TaxID=261658 RepID=F4PNA1_CACFS|nr:uncharacterized protein DFA_05084 [Cavenderia fasciculata]EGG22954.1 hypothetical protein DFA_05084 [Cavenderia fasciculata]|eukprot:XP_004360805.1 hypothetical protein DFA_05084 [Cavenderia fasciculata]